MYVCLGEGEQIIDGVDKEADATFPQGLTFVLKMTSTQNHRKKSAFKSLLDVLHVTEITRKNLTIQQGKYGTEYERSRL